MAKVKYTGKEPRRFSTGEWSPGEVREFDGAMVKAVLKESGDLELVKEAKRSKPAAGKEAPAKGGGDVE